MSDDEQMERYRAAAKACETTVFWHAARTPAEALRAVADDAEALELTEWDVYAERGPVARWSGRSPSCSASRRPRSSPAG